ncbi:MAG: hypothetical protein ACLR8Y_04365 [Alistipes indistinctus]
MKRITGLIRQCASPDMIVLYGRYAGGTLASALGGYELLLLTAKNPPAATEGVMRFLCEFFPCEQRAERYLCRAKPCDRLGYGPAAPQLFLL